MTPSVNPISQTPPGNPVMFAIAVETLPDDEVLRLSNSSLSAVEQSALGELLAKQREGELTPTDAANLTRRLDDYKARLVLQSRALAEAVARGLRPAVGDGAVRYSMTPHLTADFMNADSLGRVRLNTVGTIEALGRSGLRLVEGLAVVLHDDELEADGVATYSVEENLWVATIDWNAFRPVADTSRVATANPS